MVVVVGETPLEAGEGPFLFSRCLHPSYLDVFLHIFRETIVS